MSALPPKQAFTDCDLDSVRVSAFGQKQTFATLSTAAHYRRSIDQSGMWIG